MPLELILSILEKILFGFKNRISGKNETPYNVNVCVLGILAVLL